MQLIAGIDLGGTAVNYTLIDLDGRFLIEDLCEHPARSVEGPDVCLQQIEDGLAIAVARVGASPADVIAVGLDTPGPASATGVLSAKGSTNFVHPNWAGFDLPGNLTVRLKKPVCYLNDGNAGALWGHYNIFGSTPATSISAIVGTRRSMRVASATAPPFMGTLRSARSRTRRPATCRASRDR